MFFVLKKLGNFDRFFSNLGKTRENLKMDGEVIIVGTKINLFVEFKEDES